VKTYILKTINRRRELHPKPKKSNGVAVSRSNGEAHPRRGKPLLDIKLRRLQYIIITPCSTSIYYYYIIFYYYNTLRRAYIAHVIIIVVWSPDNSSLDAFIILDFLFPRIDKTKTRKNILKQRTR